MPLTAFQQAKLVEIEAAAYWRRPDGSYRAKGGRAVYKREADALIAAGAAEPVPVKSRDGFSVTRLVATAEGRALLRQGEAKRYG